MFCQFLVHNFFLINLNNAPNTFTRLDILSSQNYFALISLTHETIDAMQEHSIFAYFTRMQNRLMHSAERYSKWQKTIPDSLATDFWYLIVVYRYTTIGYPYISQFKMKKPLVMVNKTASQSIFVSIELYSNFRYFRN